MIELTEWEARHPVITGIAGVVLIGFSAWQLYQIGVAVGSIRMAHSDAARAASEALGG